MLIVNSPQNPTGGILTRDDCEAIARLAIEHDLIVLSDEIYNRLSYDGAHVSLYGIDGMAERTIYMDGLSKAWAMCGWRLGFGAMPVEIARKMDTLMINSSSCAAAFTQWAAVEAFDSPESDAAVDRMVAEFGRRRDRIVELLNEIPGFKCHRPAGAFYVFPDITATGFGDRELAALAARRGRRRGPPRAAPSDPTAPVTSASATRHRSPTSRRRRAGSRSTSAPRSPDDPSMARRPMNEPLPGLEETRRRLTDHDVVAVVLELPIGEATPVAAMRALGTEASCFLLESVDGQRRGGSAGRCSATVRRA